ncbi:NmrA family transcriptional regulator [Methylobacillus sp. MM3]|uniref:SDR family oxidoreductase n=1 Tax=Methylobacillus sp. MM3 TaxID=1848039 RepID=UPI0007DE6DC5|nr:SDR family oxidoreductase [Methylobacillus sp. MM3]OAJ69449.1 NmrA family transcriptional regulator [Methylobacillus sp. MM3]
MKIVVIGGTGLIGKKVVRNLRQIGHDVLPASPNTGVNTITGEGLTEAITGADIVIDVANSPSFEDAAVMQFFETAGHNIAAAEQVANVKHHIALSVVGTENLQESGYFRAKLVQENLIKRSGIPYTIVRATQFFEFLNSIADSATSGDQARLTSALFQPMAAEDVASLLSRFSLETPRNRTIDIAGPEKLPLHDAVQAALKAKKDPRKVIQDDKAPYFGMVISDRSLTPQGEATLGQTTLKDWLALQ